MMTWTPLHAAHSIERIRIQVNFETPLSDKMLDKVGVDLEAVCTSAGLDNVERVPSAIVQLPLQVGNMPIFAQMVQPATKLNGWSFKKIDGELVTEEFALRDMRLGYSTTEYIRWENLAERFWDFAEVPLERALDAVQIENIRIEYWDRFAFDGDAAHADIAELLSYVDPVFPKAVTSGGSLWHLHRGWFHDAPLNKMLVNINIDANDVQGPDGSLQRSVGFYNFVEYRTQGVDLSVAEAKSQLQLGHEISLDVFGSSVNPNIRDAIGLKLRNA